MNDIIFTTSEEFECAVMQKILEEETSINRLLREQYKNARVTGRHFTGVGFFTDFSIPEHIDRITEPVPYGYGDAPCYLNNTIMCDFILFIEDGVMIFLEGHTYGDPWPDSITTYSLHSNPE